MELLKIELIGGKTMTKEQKEIVKKEIILLDAEDVMEVTGWSINVVKYTFAHDEDFPTIKKGKKNQVELEALKKYLGKRRTNK